MAEAGKIDHSYTKVEVDEWGNILLVLNYGEESVLLDLQDLHDGVMIVEEEEYLDDLLRKVLDNY